MKSVFKGIGCVIDLILAPAEKSDMVDTPRRQ